MNQNDKISRINTTADILSVLVVRNNSLLVLDSREVFRFCLSNSTKLSYVSCYNSARRVHLADSNYLIDDKRSGSLSSIDRKISFSNELTCMTQAKTEWKYKKRKNLESRIAESQEIFKLYPKSVPVVLEKAPNGRVPTALKEKYLVPRSLAVADFLLMVQKNVLLHDEAALYLIAGQENILSASWTMGEVFDKEKDEDGFLYLMYNSFYNITCNRSSGRNL